MEQTRITAREINKKQGILLFEEVNDHVRAEKFRPDFFLFSTYSIQGCVKFFLNTDVLTFSTILPRIYANVKKMLKITTYW